MTVSARFLADFSNFTDAVKKAEASLESLRSMVHTDAKVIRDGHASTVPSEDLVPGDLVVVDGSLSSTTVTATAVHDLGQMMKRNKALINKPANMWGGTVTTVSGSTITITGMNKTGSSQGVWGDGAATGAAWVN